MPPMFDPLDTIRNMGVKVVWMEDFDHRVYLCDDVRVALIDRRVPVRTAAACLLDLIAAPGLDQREAS